MKAHQQIRRAVEMLGAGEAIDRSSGHFRRIAEEVRQRALPWLLADGVQGLGVAPRVTNGEMQPELALKVYVERKLSTTGLGDQAIPPNLAIPGVDAPLPIDIEAIGRLSAQSFRDVRRPLIRGASIGLKSLDGGSGTLGAFVRRRGEADTVYLLSCAHVLFTDFFADKTVCQPSVEYDPDGDTNAVADFTDWAMIRFDDDRFSNRVDAAIAKLRPDIDIAPVAGLSATGDVARNSVVALLGATSNESLGRVKDVFMRARLHYDSRGRSATFRDQILCTPMSKGGDSGSLVVNSTTNKAIGLLIGGSEEVSVVTPIGFVLAELGIELISAETAKRVLDSDPALIADPSQQPRWRIALDAAHTNGCSPRTHEPGGIAASHALASADSQRGKRLLDRFRQVGKETNVPASVLCALASRESRIGMPGILSENGFGDHGNGFGILQVDRRSHRLQGVSDPSGMVHLRQAADIFAAGRDQVAAKHPDWSDADILKGAMVAYNSNVKNVQSIARMDIGTTHNDYGADVTARAQFYLSEGMD